ncbi:PAS domain-containing protein [Skermanella mucosa]|uniref:sensor histidine kinase n=1 Tax=Skermanella mucosa TaxID=1789672 RepID=UPI00192C64E2|nr:histidine kinase dimerization/phosphoacceptor domain -containing protein [Skermanella mucosa]UEM23113.1 PAS domain-containing protein [Skermanella mucosa]
MLDYVLSSASFLPHGFCLLWRPDLVALHVASDITTGLAYFSIPFVILRFLKRRPDFEYRWVAYLFAAFIVLCGTTHFASVAMLWKPYYGLDGLLKLMAAIVSVTTAALLWPLLPKILAIPSPRLLAEANSRLEAEILERRAAEAELQQARDDLERLVAERTVELARSEERARLAAEAGNIGTWDWDLTTGMVTRSPECLALFGHALDGSPAVDAFFRCLHPDDRVRVRRETKEALVSGKWRSEFRVILPDGNTRWFDCRGSVLYEKILGELEPVRFVGTISNITEKIGAAEAMHASLVEKETLLREIHHRVKNNLQTLLALLQMEKRQVSDPALASRFDAMRSRIQVMASIHENLYSSDGLSAVNMGKQMTSLCEGLRQLGSGLNRIEIVTDVEDLFCSIDLAVPLGVLANEIVTNAVKHAFPDSRTGRIEVSLRHRGQDVLLRVRDNGIGDACKAKGGIGKQLITALAGQLRADISVDVQAGTLVQVRLPAEDFKRHSTKPALLPAVPLDQYCYSV